MKLNLTKETFNLYWADFEYIAESCWYWQAESWRNSLDHYQPVGQNGHLIKNHLIKMFAKTTIQKLISKTTWIWSSGVLSRGVISSRALSIRILSSGALPGGVLCS